MANTAQTTRFYVHGDEREGTAESFYCARCDAFEGRGHFNTEDHVERRVELYERSVNAWRALQKSKPIRYRRPSKAKNIIADEAAADKRRRRAAPTDFLKWLARQDHRDDPIGDLAADVKRDKRFPVTTTSRDMLNEHLRSRGACAEALVALDEAVKEFEGREGPVRTGLSKKVRFDVFKADGYSCQICGKRADSGARLEVDHKIPVAKGGTNERSNLWTLCFDCNRGKRDTFL
ncbi:YozE family protein [Sorangium cellulosum]|uniref:YozE family protein n=1 Tax=Sorangium TaxID=39643 RepID=UPI003D9C2DB1